MSSGISSVRSITCVRRQSAERDGYSCCCAGMPSRVLLSAARYASAPPRQRPCIDLESSHPCLQFQHLPSRRERGTINVAPHCVPWKTCTSISMIELVYTGHAFRRACFPLERAGKTGGIPNLMLRSRSHRIGILCLGHHNQAARLLTAPPDYAYKPLYAESRDRSIDAVTVTCAGAHHQRMKRRDKQPITQRTQQETSRWGGEARACGDKTGCCKGPSNEA